MRAKKKCIAALACLNVALVAALFWVAAAPPAQAQGFIAATDYLMVTGRIASDRSAVYVLDLARHVLAVWQIDTTTKDFDFLGARDLKGDFRPRRQP